MNTEYQVLVLGDINVDAFMSVHAYPVQGHEGLAKSFYMQVGGSAANTAVVMSKLGLKATLIAGMGCDMWADFAWKKLSDAGANLEWVTKKPGSANGLNFIPITPDGERTMFGYGGANRMLEPQDVPEAAFKEAHLLHLSGYALLEEPQRQAAWQAVYYARRADIPISLDTALEPVMLRKDEFQRLLPHVNICVLGLEEAQCITGKDSPNEAAHALRQMGVGVVAVKLGKNGCYIQNESQVCEMGVFPVRVVDTTGAGDSFSAGLIYGWLRGWELGSSTALATGLAALATTVSGGGDGLFGRQDLLPFLRAQLEDEANIRCRGVIEDVLGSLENE